MAMQRVGGIITLRVNGTQQNAKGNFSYNLGKPKRTEVIGSDGKVHGFKDEGQAGMIEGAITDRGSLDLASLMTAEGLTVTLELANGKVIICNQAVNTSEGTGSTDEGEIPVRFVGDTEEVRF